MTAHSPTDWQTLPVESGEPDQLLARGIALLNALAADPRPTLRWYRATSPALVLGRGQGSLAITPTDNLHVITRYSGGGAVLLDEGLLSLDVLIPAGHPLLDGDLGTVFERIGGAWAVALRSLGVPDISVHDGPGTAQRQGDARQRLLATVCYATLGRGEVLTKGRKVVGLSQRRRRPGALVQCGLLRRWRPAPLLAALGTDPADAEILGHAVGIDELMDDPPSDDALMEAVRIELARAGRAGNG